MTVRYEVRWGDSPGKRAGAESVEVARMMAGMLRAKEIPNVVGWK